MSFEAKKNQNKVCMVYSIVIEYFFTAALLKHFIV